MNMDVEEIIRQRPYLKDPLRIYERVTEFIAAVRKFSLGVTVASPDHKAYAPVFIDPVFERFSTIFELPEGSLSPLKQAMELGDIDFLRLPYGEVPAFSLPYPEEDLAMLLFLVSRPYFLALGEAARRDGEIPGAGEVPGVRGPAVARVGRRGFPPAGVLLLLRRRRRLPCRRLPHLPQ